MAFSFPTPIGVVRTAMSLVPPLPETGHIRAPRSAILDIVTMATLRSTLLAVIAIPAESDDPTRVVVTDAGVVVTTMVILALAGKVRNATAIPATVKSAVVDGIGADMASVFATVMARVTRMGVTASITVVLAVT